LAALLDPPAHLVAHSYGGIGALLAAARRPTGALSVTVIEPPAFALARGVPEVETLIRRAERLFTRPAGMSEEEFLMAFLRSWGLQPAPLPRLNAAARRSVRASMTERPPWEAELPLDALRATGVPVLVVRGGWDAAPTAARDLAGRAFAAVCDVLERDLAADAALFPGANHSPQALGAPFNERLERFWRRG
jgi:pimeloyl-ACP methyl ester carboxylesterase